MFDKLKEVEQRFDEIQQKLMDPAVVTDQKLYTSLMRETKKLTPIVEKFREYNGAKENLEDAKQLISDGETDKEMKEMLEEEIENSKQIMEKCADELKILLLPSDPNDDKNVIIEIRGGAGGEEAALFAGELLRMYTMYAESKGWKVDMLSANETGLGGYKEVSFMVEGEGAYSRLKFESGGHRVQRVPETESQGRIHTSAVTVAVLPEAEDVEIDINPADLQIDTYRSSGAGGQHVNKTESAIRITHLPTGTIVECQDERSQHKNREKAMKILRSRIYDKVQQEQQQEIAETRKTLVGSGDRSQRVRTYNFPQSRITDHRIGLTIYKLEQFMNGDLDEVIDALITADRAEQLKADGGND